MSPGVSVVGRYTPLWKTCLFWHDKWTCPPRCTRDRSVHQPTRWTVANVAHPSVTHLGGHAHLWWRQKSQIFKRACNGYSHSHLVACHGTFKVPSLRICCLHIIVGMIRSGCIAVKKQCMQYFHRFWCLMFADYSLSFLSHHHSLFNSTTFFWLQRYRVCVSQATRSAQRNKAWM